MSHLCEYNATFTFKNSQGITESTDSMNEVLMNSGRDSSIEVSVRCKCGHFTRRNYAYEEFRSEFNSSGVYGNW